MSRKRFEQAQTNPLFGVFLIGIDLIIGFLIANDCRTMWIRGLVVFIIMGSIVSSVRKINWYK